MHNAKCIIILIRLRSRHIHYASNRYYISFLPKWEAVHKNLRLFRLSFFPFCGTMEKISASRKEDHPWLGWRSPSTPQRRRSSLLLPPLPPQALRIRSSRIRRNLRLSWIRTGNTGIILTKNCRRSSRASPGSKFIWKTPTKPG